MFRRLQWKIVVMFVMLVMAIMFIISGFMMLNIIHYYERDFKLKMDGAFGGEFTSGITDILNDDAAEGKEKMLSDVISAYSAQLGLGEERTLSVLYADNAEEIVSTAPFAYGERGIKREKTPNIILAMSGKKGDKFQFSSDYMDYAHYIKGGNRGGYIVYVKDSKRSVMTLMKNVTVIVFQAILFGIAAAIVLGYFLSGAITTPITVLTEKAEDFAEGNFDSNLEIASKDEIGTLMETFNYMGKIMSSALNEIAAEKHKIEIILEHVTNGIIAFNTEQKIIHINSAAKNLLGIDNPEDIRFDDFFEKISADVCMAEFMYLERLHTEERELVAGDKHIKMYFVPFMIENAKVAGVVGVLEDITEQQKLENSRKKFVAEVSHELKTPLTTIGAYTETLLDGYLDDKETAEEFLKTIQKETVKMTSLVKNLLTLSRFDSQKMEMNKESFYLDELLKDITNTFKIEAEGKQLDLEYNLINNIPEIYADKFQIERAIKNIVSNAIKYTQTGGSVKIFAGCFYNEAYVKVEDNGIGIPEGDIEHIFERFYRVDKARSREQGGTGLGLSISKEIIEKHGGSITAESKKGEYTRFTLRLPVTSIEEKKDMNEII